MPVEQALAPALDQVRALKPEPIGPVLGDADPPSPAGVAAGQLVTDAYLRRWFPAPTSR
jgi:hypothetical protein